VSFSFFTTRREQKEGRCRLTVSLITSSVRGKRQVGEHEVERSESSIESLVGVGEGLVQGSSNLLSLQRPRSGEDGEFREGLESREGSPGSVGVLGSVGLEGVIGLEHELNLVLDVRSVRTKILQGKSRLDGSLLLDKDVVGNVVDDSLSKDGGGEMLRGRGKVEMRREDESEARRATEQESQLDFGAL